MKIDRTRIKKRAKNMNTVFGVFYGVAVGVGIVAFLGFIATFIIPNSFFTSSIPKGDSMRLTMNGMINFKIDPELYKDINIKPFFQVILPMASLISLMIAAIIYHVRKILQTVRDDCPFDKQNPRRLKIIGAILLIGSVVINAIEGLVAMSIIDVLKINYIDIKISLNLPMFFTGVLILVLAGVFQYGSYLQEEYDATL